MPNSLGARILHCRPSGRPQQLDMRPPHSTLVQPVPSSRPPLFCSRPLLLTPPLLLLRAGRLVIELFEDVAPAAARHLLTRCTPGAEANVQGTLFHKLLPGFGLFGGKRWVTWAWRDTSALHCLQPALQLGSCTQGLLLVGGLWTVWGQGVGGMGVGKHPWCRSRCAGRTLPQIAARFRPVLGQDVSHHSWVLTNTCIQGQPQPALCSASLVAGQQASKRIYSVPSSVQCACASTARLSHTTAF